MGIDRTLLREQDARLKSAWHEIEEASQRILTQLSDADSVTGEEAQMALDAAYVIWRVDQGMHELVDLHRAISERLNLPARPPAEAVLPREGGYG
jgi:glutathione S-transferase